MSALARASHPVGFAPPRKPLYLSVSQPATLDRQADTLLLRRTDAPAQRFPFTRISRILCTRHVTWSGEALTRCLAEGITITWIDGHGRALGYCEPRQARPDDFSTLIETWLELRDWPHRLANWRARRRLETLSTCAQRALEAGKNLSAERFEELKRAFVYRGEVPATFDHIGQAWALALVVDHLHRAGLQSRYFAHDGQPLELGDELAALLWAELNLDCGNLVCHADTGILAAQMFESWARRREERLQHHLGDLRRHLAREVKSWR